MQRNLWVARLSSNYLPEVFSQIFGDRSRACERLPGDCANRNQSADLHRSRYLELLDELSIPPRSVAALRRISVSALVS